MPRLRLSIRFILVWRAEPQGDAAIRRGGSITLLEIPTAHVRPASPAFTGHPTTNCVFLPLRPLRKGQRRSAPRPIRSEGTCPPSGPYGFPLLRTVVR